MNIRNIIIPTIVGLTALLSTGCDTKNTDTRDPLLDAQFSFTLKVSEVSYDQAKISVKHNGPEEVTWYGFLTTDLKTSDFDLFYDKLTELQSQETIKGLRKTNNRTVTLDGLDDQTKYKYIVFAITEDGQIFNNVEMEVVTFTTGANIYVLTETEDWKLSYLGREPESQKEIVNVESTGGLFAWDYVSKESIAAFDKQYPDGFEIYDENENYMTTVNGLQLYILQQIANIQMYVAQGESITSMTYNEGGQYEMPRIMSGDYYFIAYGFRADGQHTQKYSVSEFSIKEEASTPEYEKWFGTYTFTGKVELKDMSIQDRSYTITIEHIDNNFMYRVRGWECGETVENDWEIDIMGLDKTKGEYIGFPGYFNKGNFEIQETPITQITFDGKTALTMGIYGYATDNNGNMSPTLFEGMTMASAAPLSAENTSTLVGKTGKYDTLTWEYQRIGYLAWNPADFSYMTPLNPAMHLPISITKVSDAVPGNARAAFKAPAIEATKAPFSQTANTAKKPVIFSMR